MKHLIILSILCIYNVSFAQQSLLKLKNGPWVSTLQLTNKDYLPFNMRVKDKNTLCVFNGEEEIVLEQAVVRNDSFIVRFPYFNSELVFAVNSKKNISGYWQNFNKGNNYKIPFESHYNKKGARFATTQKSKDGFPVGGRWQVEFEPNTEHAYPAVGLFIDLGKSQLSGTFLTETGDYRFLAGNYYGDSMFLSCFDGSHAFLFKAIYKNNSLQGKFFSGNHWSCDWTASKNENFEIKDPEDLTYLKDDKKTVEFKLKTIDGELYSFPNDNTKDKTVIIQIMGSWCPNCLDETMYYKRLFEMYHDQGLEIVSIGYEVGDSFEVQAENIRKLKEKLGLDFTFLVGGKASKGKASEDFNMLNAIISFPTSIFIGKDGKVKRIHTGFNGPGTGQYYQDYIRRTESLVELLISQ